MLGGLTYIVCKKLDKRLTNACYRCIFVLWFFHNSIRFKVNKVWLGLVVRQALIVYRGLLKIEMVRVCTQSQILIKSTYPGHIFVCQFEIRTFQILCQSLFMDGFGDDYHSTFQIPA